MRLTEISVNGFKFQLQKKSAVHTAFTLVQAFCHLMFFKHEIQVLHDMIPCRSIKINATAEGSAASIFRV
jgi:hypothetical protein